MYATADDIAALHGADFLLLVAARGQEASLDDPLTVQAIRDALAQASSECDSYLSTRYPTPLASAPRVLVNIVIDIALYRLASTADRMSELIQERYKQAVAWLKDISAGRANLPGAPDGSGSTLAAPPPELAEFSGPPAVFQRGGW